MGLGCLPASQTAALSLLPVTGAGGSYCQGNKADDTVSVRDTNHVESVKRRIGRGSGTVSNLRCVCRYLSASSTLEDWNEKLTQSEA